MKRWIVGILFLMVGLVTPQSDGEAQQPLTQATIIQQACVGSTSACLNMGTQGIEKNASIQRVILLGCLAEYTASRTSESKHRANECMMTAAGFAMEMSTTALTAGQSILRENLAIQPETDEELASLLRIKLGAIPVACGQIKHLYTKYNCLTKRLYKLDSGE